MNEITSIDAGLTELPASSAPASAPAGGVFGALFAEFMIPSNDAPPPETSGPEAQQNPVPGTWPAIPAPETQLQNPAPAMRPANPTPETQQQNPVPGTRPLTPAPEMQLQNPAPAMRPLTPATETHQQNPAPAASPATPVVANPRAGAAEQNIPALPIRFPRTGVLERPNTAAIKQTKDDDGTNSINYGVVVPFFRHPGADALAEIENPGSRPGLPSNAAPWPGTSTQVPSEVRSIQVQTESIAIPKPLLGETETPEAPPQSQPVTERHPDSPEMPPKPASALNAWVAEAGKTLIAPAPRAGNFSQQNSGEHEKQSTDSSPKTETSHVAMPSDAPARFDAQLVASEPSGPVAHVRELPPQPPLPVAHKVSIDIGDGDNRVTVTLHERGGDVSVKVHSATEPVRTELQASVGTLVEAFRRENVPLGNMDFTSGYHHNAADSGREQPPQQRPKRNFRIVEPENVEEGPIMTGFHFQA